MIYVIKQEGLYQNNVNTILVLTCTCKMACYLNLLKNQHFLSGIIFMTLS